MSSPVQTAAYRLSKIKPSLPLQWEEIKGERPQAVRICAVKETNDTICRTFRTLGGWAFLGKNCVKLPPEAIEFQPRPEGEKWENL